MPKLDDYEVVTFIAQSGQHAAMIEEMFGLFGVGASFDEARRHLEQVFNERVREMQERGETIPLPGSGKEMARIAPTSQIESLGSLVDDFWLYVLEYKGGFKFVSDESTLDGWGDRAPGGREAVIRRAYGRYGVDISPWYGELVWKVLKRIKDDRDRKLH